MQWSNLMVLCTTRRNLQVVQSKSLWPKILLLDLNLFFWILLNVVRWIERPGVK